jgi:hypothetical protein
MRPWPDAAAKVAPEDAVPVAVEVVRDGRQPGSRPGQRGGSAPGCNHLGRQFAAGEVADGGALSWLLFLKHRLLHVAEALGVVVEREVVVEVESKAMRERLALLELKLAELVHRPGVATVHPRRHVKSKNVRVMRPRVGSLTGVEVHSGNIRVAPVRQGSLQDVVDGLGVRGQRRHVRSAAVVVRPVKEDGL